MGIQLDEQFIGMLNGYRGSGGLARPPEVLALFNRWRGADAATLERCIVDREVICFEWQSQPWIPMFQFDRLCLGPNVKPTLVFGRYALIERVRWQPATWQ